MCVLKIIYSHPDIFNPEPTKTYSKLDAIKLIALMKNNGYPSQKDMFEYRITYLAICNLNDLGFMKTASDMAKELLTKTTSIHQYKMAQDLCDILFKYYFLQQDLPSADKYLLLYHKYSLSISYDQQCLKLLAEVVKNYLSYNIIDKQKAKTLFNTPIPSEKQGAPWFQFLQYQLKVILNDRVDLRSLLIEAIKYFDQSYPKHKPYSDYFYAILIDYYLETGDILTAEDYLKRLEGGTSIWFKLYFSYAKILLSKKDLRSNDICLEVMNHNKYTHLSFEEKAQWKEIYKMSVRLLLKY